MIASFTKAAAKELAGRDLQIEKHRCGTLHAHCFRALGNPKVAESQVDKFNEQYPQFFMSAGSVDTDEGEFDQKATAGGDEVMAEYQVMRAKRVQRKLWAPKVESFAKAWEEFKFKNNFTDFTDMIEKCIAFPERVIPEGTTIGIFDEVQDFTPMQLELVRAIGSKLNYFLLAGDDDQTIYGFTGATPKAFLEPDIPDECKKILNQSYRVPRAVQALAEQWIKQIKDRQPKEYKPRDFEGEVRHLPHATSRSPDEVVEKILIDNEEGKTSMVLASCSYMIEGVIHALKDQGVPFHNPYKTKRGDWNPLGAKRGTSSKDRLLMYLDPQGPQAGSARLWTVEQLAGWVDLVEAKGLLTRGSKKEIKEAAERRDEFTPQGLIRCYTEWFTPDGLNAAICLKPHFIETRVVSSKKKALMYPIKVINKNGIDALRQVPRICVGTIHSVKGGQADNVYLFPDLSSNAMRQYIGHGHDSVIRQYYVGMTRCREKLFITGDASRGGVNLKMG
jgi:DNA helicase-2/ATP-dependent DNA helicase PcrA